MEMLPTLRSWGSRRTIPLKSSHLAVPFMCYPSAVDFRRVSKLDRVSLRLRKVVETHEGTLLEKSVLQRVIDGFRPSREDEE